MKPLVIRPTTTISVQVPVPVHNGIADLAKAAGYPRDLYASNLLIAAYSAKRKRSGDNDLDDAVAQAGVAHSDAVSESINAQAFQRAIDEAARIKAACKGEIDKLNRDLASAKTIIAADRETIKRYEGEKSISAKALDERDQKIADLKKRLADREAAYAKTNEGAAAIEKFGAPHIHSSLSPRLGDEIADCTRRTIIGLKAAGLSAVAIAKETDQPLNIVNGVLAKRKAGAP